MRSRAALLLALVLALTALVAGCGSSSDDTADPAATGRELVERFLDLVRSGDEWLLASHANFGAVRPSSG